MNKLGFRLTIATYLLVLLGYFSYFIAIAPHWPSEAIEYYHWWQDQQIVADMQSFRYLGMLLTGIMFLSGVGLLFFRSLSRHIFAASIFVLACLEITEPLPFLVSGDQVMIDSLLGLLSGAVVALSYWGSVAKNFKQSA